MDLENLTFCLGECHEDLLSLIHEAREAGNTGLAAMLLQAVAPLGTTTQLLMDAQATHG